ncbi:hypothetical protein Tco_0798819 [Tanacetum coccineum]
MATRINTGGVNHPTKGKLEKAEEDYSRAVQADFWDGEVHEENEACLPELETIGEAYYDDQAQNQQLLQQSTDIDNYRVIIQRSYYTFPKSSPKLLNFHFVHLATPMCGSTELGSRRRKGRSSCSHLTSQAARQLVQQSLRIHGEIHPPVSNTNKKHVLDQKGALVVLTTTRGYFVSVVTSTRGAFGVQPHP